MSLHDRQRYQVIKTYFLSHDKDLDASILLASCQCFRVAITCPRPTDVTYEVYDYTAILSTYLKLFKLDNHPLVFFCLADVNYALVSSIRHKSRLRLPQNPQIHPQNRFFSVPQALTMNSTLCDLPLSQTLLSTYLKVSNPFVTSSCLSVQSTLTMKFTNMSHTIEM